MQLSYRGRHYTPVLTEVPVLEQPFEGRFLGVSSTLTTAYRSGTPNASIPLTYRGQRYLSDR